MLVSDLRPLAAASPRLTPGMGGMLLHWDGEFSAGMRKKEFVTLTLTVATVAIEVVTKVFHKVLGWVGPVLSTAVCWE